jgi:hypothetical protein
MFDSDRLANALSIEEIAELVERFMRACNTLDEALLNDRGEVDLVRIMTSDDPDVLMKLSTFGDGLNEMANLRGWLVERHPPMGGAKGLH